jgi:hypothetical protein
MLRTCSFSLMAALAAGLLFPGLSLGGGKPHPHIHHALFELREARSELKAAGHNFGGHRREAIRDIDSAVGQLEKALKFSGDKRPFKGNPKAEVYKKYATYPHIRHAVVELKETVSELKAASHNYGGHRQRALDATRAAITQLEVCIKFAKGKK